VPTVVAALGGHALAEDRPGAKLGGVPPAIARLVGLGWNAVVTHGSGPQVGARLLAPRAPGHDAPGLDRLDAEIQGALGYVLQQALGNALHRAGAPRTVVSLVTQVIVDPRDRAFASPSKPVGRFFGRDEAERLRSERGWVMAEDAGRGYRRVVPSPEPLEIVEWRAVKALVAAGILVLAVGGGGIPVARAADGTLQGVEAVVDKDRASALLARLLGADLLVIFTGVEAVCLDYQTPQERPLRHLTVSEARKYLAEGQFAPGSMGPKVEAAAGFTGATGRPSLITTPARLLDALSGTAGTTLHP
jgi:carbamate kinase